MAAGGSEPAAAVRVAASLRSSMLSVGVQQDLGLPAGLPACLPLLLLLSQLVCPTAPVSHNFLTHYTATKCYLVYRTKKNSDIKYTLLS